MNYIEQIKGFWRSHDVEVFPTTTIAVYFYLLEVNNKVNWMPSFKRNNSKITADLGISYPTLNNSRNRLKQAGLIDFKSQNGSANVTYTLKEFLKVTNEVSVEVGNEVTNEVGSGSFMTKDKLKHKTKTKTNSSSDAKAPVEKEPTKYWSSFVDIWFRRYEEVTTSKPTFNKANAANLKSIILRLEKMYKTKNEKDWDELAALKTFNKFIDNALKDEWLKANLLITNLSAKFDTIVNQPKDGKFNNSGTANSNSGYQHASINTNDLIQQLTDDAENGNIPGQYS
ncbi:hypothetical protein [Flavobacterium sp. 25HG05S-40]|uniref:hypothetical protein n=1 Tax=Flavobacterium sp. 25HG05S-40 TaxID=3458682 RepID=UPI004043B6FE